MDDVPFLKVGYASFLAGRFISKDAGTNDHRLSVKVKIPSPNIQDGPSTIVINAVMVTLYMAEYKWVTGV